MVGKYSSFVIMLFFGSLLLVDAIPCQDAIARMLPCQGFLVGIGDISVACCRSAQSLSQIANTNPQDRISICQCLKQAANIVGMNVERAQQIPRLCHIDLASAFIDPNVDCNTLNAPSPQINSADDIAPSPQLNTADKITPLPADSAYSPQNEGERMQLNKLDQIWDKIIAPSPVSPQI